MQTCYSQIFEKDSSLLRHYLQCSQDGLRFWEESKAARFFSYGFCWKYWILHNFILPSYIWKCKLSLFTAFPTSLLLSRCWKRQFHPAKQHVTLSMHHVPDVFINKGILAFQVKIKVSLLTMKTKIMMLALFMKDIIMTNDTKWWFTEIIQQNTFPGLK